MLLFGDFKQLPPATSQAPFIVDPFVTRAFDFRTLSQNRRVVEDDTRKPELDKFHEALTSISEGTPDEVVRQFFVDCYVRGARVSAENVDFEGSITPCLPPCLDIPSERKPSIIDLAASDKKEEGHG